MNDAALIARLAAFEAPATGEARQRAVEAVPARIRRARLPAEIEAGRRSAPKRRGKSELPRRGLAIILGGIGLAAVVAIVVLFAAGSADQPSKAYGAEVIRFAESTPLLLLEGPGWRVENVTEEERREGIEGRMEFVTGKPIQYESMEITGDDETGQYETGMAPAAVRQRKVELVWRRGSLGEALTFAHRRLHAHGQRWVELPVLGTTAYVDTRDEVFVNQGGPNDRQMTAYWTEDGYLLELRAAVRDQAGLEERLGWLTKVDSQTWLDAMPAKVVKAADHKAAVREMLKGIPVPSTFRPSRIPDPGLTTDRDQVAATVTNTVSCLWFRQWGEARRSGDHAAELEAEKAMATSRHWPILLEMASEGGRPFVWELAEAMPGGYWDWHAHRRSLLAHAEGLACARLGLPLLPRKMKLQRERGVPLPPR
ncbi:MAG: hypothetical protein QOF85_2542 [Solirubrobacterales bacterium]|jgi:hypothetical protein|nr:hypothetical protein [Solirubrobacterales bacterium]